MNQSNLKLIKRSKRARSREWRSSLRKTLRHSKKCVKSDRLSSKTHRVPTLRLFHCMSCQRRLSSKSSHHMFYKMTRLRARESLTGSRRTRSQTNTARTKWSNSSKGPVRPSFASTKKISSWRKRLALRNSTQRSPLYHLVSSIPTT